MSREAIGELVDRGGFILLASLDEGGVSAVLMRTDPFRELDRLTQQVFGTNGTATRPVVMPMDAYRDGEEYVIHFDVPGVDPGNIDLNVEHHVLTVQAERKPSTGAGVDYQVAERPTGVASRQLFLGDTLDTSRINAHCEAGVLTLRIPVREQTEPRKIEISASSQGPATIDA
jgi:HSP20 family protein